MKENITSSDDDFDFDSDSQSQNQKNEPSTIKHANPTSNTKQMRRQMSSIGRFSLRSQTKENPSIITFFVALVHDDGNDISEEEFIQLWEERVMKKYDRFTFQVCSDDDRYFEVRINKSINHTVNENNYDCSF